MTRFKLAVPLVCALVVAPRPAASQSPDAGAQRVERLMRQMTLEEKVGQMTQLALQMILSRPGGPGSPAVIDSAKLHDVVVRRGVGALLNVAYVAMSPEEWRAANETIARFAARSRLKIPVVYGIDAVRLRVFRGELATQRDAELSCRDVFRASPHPIEAIGPALVEEASLPHVGAWR